MLDWKRLFPAVFILLAVLAVYAPSMRGEFLWDDDTLLINNPLVRAPGGFQNIWFSAEHADDFKLTHTAFWLEWRLWGMNARGYRITNVVLHGIGAALLWLVLRRVAVPGAWAAALLFALHPVNVASVAWISEQKNTLSLIFSALTALAYLRYDRDAGFRFYALALFLFFLALSAKTSVVTLPLVLLLCVWYRRGRLVWRDGLRVAPFLALSAVMGAITMGFQLSRAIGDAVVRPESPLARILDAALAVWFYAWKAVWPRSLMMVYPRYTLDPGSILSFLPLAALLAGFILLWRFRRSWGRGPLFAAACYVLLLLPVLGFVDMYYMVYSLVADQWQYLALIALPAAAVPALYMVCRRLGAQAPFLSPVLLTAAACACAVLTWRRAAVFENERTLWSDTVARHPACWVGHGNLGVALVGEGRLDEALSHLREAVRLRPFFVKALNNMGFVLALQGKPREARELYDRALAIEPGNTEVIKNLADLLVGQGDKAGAERRFLQALELRPSYAEARNNYGSLLTERGDMKKAAAEFKQATMDAPDYAEAHFNLGAAYMALGNPGPAIGPLTRAVRLKPELAIGHAVLGDALVRSGRAADALTAYRKALSLRPDWPEVQRKLAGLSTASSLPWQENRTVGNDMTR